MSLRSWTEASWSYRALTALPSPMPSSRILPRIPRVDFAVIAALALYVAHVHGFLAGALAAVAAVVLTEIAAHRPEGSVSLLLVAYAAAPRIDAHLRAEDFVVLGIALAAIRKRGLLVTPLDTPIALFGSFIGLSLVVGLASGTIAHPPMAAFTALKIVEYIVGFYAAYALGARLDRAMVVAVAILAIVVMIQLLGRSGERPLDRWPYKAEANHVGGVAVLAAALFLARGRRFAALLSCALVVATGSRVALLALAAVCLLQHGRLAWILLPATVAGAWFFLQERVERAPQEWRTFRRTERRVAEGYPPEFSYTRNRVECWSLLSEDFAKFPIVGTGPGSRDRVIYENAYVMLACEEGALGVLAFAVLIISVFFALHRAAHAGSQVAYGTAFATAAMLVLGLTSISFFVAREAGLWWMLLGSALRKTPD